MRNQKLSLKTTPAFVILGFCATMFTGCKTPDLKPFRDSTAKIQQSVAGAQDIYSGELERLRPYVPEGSDLTKQEKRFADNWALRTAVMEGMVKYAGSLAAVADAPDKSKEGLDNVGQSLKELSVAAGPYQQAIEGSTDIAVQIIDLVNRVRAALQLKKAVLATDPDIQKLAVLLASDFSTMRHTLELNQKSIRNLMNTKLSHQLDTREAIANKLEAQATELQGHLSDTNWMAAVAAFNKDVAETQKYLTDADKWYLPHQAEIDKARKEMSDRIKLFRDTETALVQWGKAHAALKEALQKDLAPDWTLLKQSADQIEKSVNKITNKDSKP